MANTLITKNSSTAAAIPTAGQLVQGELAVNVTDKRIFTENSGGTVVELGVNPSSVTTGALSYSGVFSGGTNIINIGGGQLYKEAGGKIGIATSTPAQKLHIYGNTGVTALSVGDNSIATPYILLEADATNSIQTLHGRGNFPLSFKLANTERMRLTSTGLGIGTSSPRGKLDLGVIASTTLSNNLANAQLVLEAPTGTGNFCNSIVWSESSGAAVSVASIAAVDEGSASATGIVFATGDSSALTERLRITSSGLVGIGVSSPAFKLDLAVTDTTAYSTSAYAYEPVRITNNGAGGIAGLLFQTTSTGTANTAQATISVIAESVSSKNTAITFGTRQNSNSAIPERLRIDSAGNLGLGVTPSAWGSGRTALQIGGSGYVIGVGQIDVGVNYYYDGAYRYVGTGYASSYQSYNGLHAWYNAPSGTAGNAISFTQAMTLTAAGNLGIGTSSPVNKLDLYNGDQTLSRDTGGASGTNSINFRHTVNTVAAAQIQGQYTGDFRAHLIFKINTSQSNISPVEVARIDSSGNLLVGTTSQISSGFVCLSLANNARNGIVINDTDTGGGTNSPMLFIRNSSLVGSINTTATATSYVTSSDYRLKEDWVAVADASTRVNALKPINFAWKVNGERVDGFLAHELADVVPEAVTGVKDAVDANGEPEYQGIDQSKLVPLLTAALQEALAKIESLEARLDAANI